MDNAWMIWGLAMTVLSTAAQAVDDPFGSLAWPDLQRQYFGSAPVEFDDRVQVRGPDFAEDAMNVPTTVSVVGLANVEEIAVIVDRNPIRKVLEYFPVGALPAVSFRFKLEQASPVRAAARTRDGVWHVGGTLVESAGGGCTTASGTVRDDGWSRTLGDVSAKVFPSPGPQSSPARVRVRVMHPMDTGLVAGVPAFYVNRLALRDGLGHPLMRLNAYEPVSENPVFSFDFASAPPLPLRLVGTDNNGNRIAGSVR